MSQTFVFFGIAGSGKGTQVKLLMDFLKQKDGTESLYVYPGSEYRKLIASGSYTGHLIQDSFDRGELQPDFITTSLVGNILINNLNDDLHIICDGYPRSIFQSQVLDHMVSFYKRKNVKIINIKISKEEAEKRLFLRARSDDNNHGIENRIKDYFEKVLPAMEFFRGKAGYDILDIDGEQSVESVHNDIIKMLGF